MSNDDNPTLSTIHPRPFDALSADSVALGAAEGADSKERGDGDKGDGRGEATAANNLTIADGDEFSRVARGGERERLELEGVKARTEAQHGANDAQLGFVAAIAAYSGGQQPEDNAPAPSNTPSRPENEPQTELGPIDQYQDRGNPYSLRAQQAATDAPDNMQNAVSDEARAEQAAALEARRPTMGPYKGPHLEP